MRALARIAGFLAAIALSAGFAPQARASQVIASTTYDAASAQGTFLSLGVGARPVAMGGAFTAVADDASAVNWNPGGLAQLRTCDVTAMYDSIGYGIDQDYAALAVPLGPGVAGLSLNVLNYGSFDERDANGVKTGTLSPTDYGAEVGWGFRTDNALGIQGFSALNGVSLIFSNEAAGGESIGLNAGSLFPMGDAFTLGWTVQNLGLSHNQFSLPATVKVGAAYFVKPEFTLALDLDDAVVSQDFETCIGAEYVILKTLALRAGYAVQSVNQGLSGDTGLTAGLGLDYRGISIDYAYQPFGDLTTTNRVSLNYSFGGPSFRPQASAQAGQAGPRPMATPAPQRTPEAAQQALPTDPMARAQALEQLGRNTEALEAFNAAVKANPANEAAWRGMGELYTRLGQKAYAVQCYEQVLRLRPADSQFRAWLDRFKAP